MVDGFQLTAVPSPFVVHVAVAAPSTGVYPSKHVIVCVSVATKTVAALVSCPLSGIAIGSQDKTLNEQ